MKTHSLVLMWFLAAAAHGKVTETIEFTTYDVDVSQSRSLVRAMDAASPHRVDGKVVYGMTHYRVGWNYRYLQQPDGQCKVTEVEISYAATVSMPRPVGASARQERKLTPMLAGLHVHELGHVAIGRDAAHAVEVAVSAVPGQPDCEALKTALDEAGRRAMAGFADLGKQYDLQTSHGETQGAWLYE